MRSSSSAASSAWSMPGGCSVSRTCARFARNSSSCPPPASSPASSLRTTIIAVSARLDARGGRREPRVEHEPAARVVRPRARPGTRARPRSGSAASTALTLPYADAASAARASSLSSVHEASVDSPGEPDGTGEGDLRAARAHLRALRDRSSRTARTRAGGSSSSRGSTPARATASSTSRPERGSSRESSSAGKACAVVGVDQSPEMLAEARRRTGGRASSSSRQAPTSFRSPTATSTP